MAEVQGQTLAVHRLGSKQSGAWGHVRGWDVGARVEISYENGQDVVRVYKTCGSRGGSSELIAEFSGEPVNA